MQQNRRTAFFVAPFLADTTLRFIEAAATLPGVRLGLITQDRLASLPPALEQRLAGGIVVADAMSAGPLVDAVRRVAVSSVAPSV